MQFTIVDGGVAAITLISGILAYSRGFTRELFAIGGWVLAALIAFYAAPIVEPLLRELPAVGDFLSSSPVISVIAAFTVVVAAALLVISAFTPLFSSAILASPLAPVDRTLGLVFGVARGIVLLAIGYLLYENFSGDVRWEPLETAASKPIFAQAAGIIQSVIPEGAADWFGGRIDALMASVNADGAASAAPAPEAGAATGTGTGTEATGAADGVSGSTGGTDTTTDTQN